MVWPAVDYVTQYLDEELMTTISDCTNALSISRSGKSIFDTDTDTDKDLF